MKCKSCQYSLWNLRSRTCPECGRGFSPSEYSFHPGAVRFCCPHCTQEYFGTDKDGLLEPRAFTCVNCGQGVTLDEMVLLPVEGLSEAQTSGEIMPWLERRQIGFWRAWWGTVKRAMLSPGRLLELTPAESRASDALQFACLSQMFFGLTGLMGMFCSAIFIGAIAGAGGTAISFGLSLILGFFVGIVAAILCTLVVVLAWALATHGVLRLTGKTAHGLDRSVQAIAYASGANALTGIPCIGANLWYIFSIWWLVSATLAVQAAQKVSGWRASLAVLAPPLVIVGAIVAGYAIFMYNVMQNMNQLQAGAPPGGWYQPVSPSIEEQNKQNATQVQFALRGYATANGRWPQTGLHLLAAQNLDPEALVFDTTNGRDASHVNFEGMNLLTFQVMNLEGQRQVLEAAAANVPGDVIATRFGDVVFTYQGSSARRTDPRLWLFVACPAGDPANATMVVMENGVPTILAGDERLRALAAQNLVRVELGLEPLPDPATIEGYYEKP